MIDQMRDTPPDTVTDVLAELEASSREHDEREAEYAHRMLILNPATAQFLDILIRSTGRKRILEIGTSHGYSTIWLARSLKANAGLPLVTIERNPEKHRAASVNITRAGLDIWVQQLLGEASELIPTLPGTFDCVFFDADRVTAHQQLAALLPRLEPQALLLCDNALSHPEELAPYRAYCESLPDVAATVVPVGKGLHIAYRAANTVVNSWNQHPR